ncbi:MAG: hypothetical protein AAGI69_26355 [Cyanobacteria bacterium P01_H01_bin.21]
MKRVFAKVVLSCALITVYVSTLKSVPAAQQINAGGLSTISTAEETSEENIENRTQTTDIGSPKQVRTHCNGG